jgi:hypothetical protein
LVLEDRRLNYDAGQLAAMSFTSANALTTLLATESLLFAVFAVTLGLGGSPPARTSLASSARNIAVWAAGVLTILASGAIVAWGDLFLDDWPARFGLWFPSTVVAVGALAQPIFAWVVVVNLYRRPRRDITDG